MPSQGQTYELRELAFWSRRIDVLVRKTKYMDNYVDLYPKPMTLSRTLQRCFEAFWRGLHEWSSRKFDLGLCTNLLAQMEAKTCLKILPTDIEECDKKYND